MRLIRDMSLIKDRVKALLVNHKHLRDSDNKLIATIWKQDLFNLDLNPKFELAFTFLALYADGKLTNSETIRRVRQKIQEENPELRGTVDDLRKEQGEEVRKEI